MFEDVEEERRLANLRVTQALESGASILATACPWCHTMLRNGVKDLGVEGRIAVWDIAQAVWAALQPNCGPEAESDCLP